jgi:hypothetical protein
MFIYLLLNLAFSISACTTHRSLAPAYGFECLEHFKGIYGKYKRPLIHCWTDRELIVLIGSLRMSAPLYFCDCPLFCGGTMREVAKRTYYAHAPHRRDRIRTALGDFLDQARHQVDPGPLPDAAANDDVIMLDEEDDAPIADLDVPQDPQSEDDFEDMFADYDNPEPPPLVGVALPQPEADPYVEPVRPGDQDQELLGLGGAADPEVHLALDVGLQPD